MPASLPPRLGRALRAGCLVLAVAAPAAAQAVTFQVEIQDVKLKDAKKGVSQSERKNPKLLARRMEKKAIDHRVLRTAFGTPAALALPNGARLMLTPVSVTSGTMKVHVRLMVYGNAGLDMDMKVPVGKAFPVSGGPYNDALLMVMCTPSVD